jgi:outer membrane receptor for ferrienterochelin and colicins
VMGGVTADLPGRLTATLRGRYIGHRTTVLSNPVGEVPGFATLDAAVNAVDLPVPGLGLSLTVTNLLDRAYAHPGVREADAGTTPGSFDAAGRWTGSAGFYSSLLPQPGRCATLSFLFRY